MNTPAVGSPTTAIGAQQMEKISPKTKMKGTAIIERPSCNELILSLVYDFHVYARKPATIMSEGPMTTMIG